ncbi:MAG: hypothetical protein ACFFAO_00540 [Candidatus Hermodarchaeota archaeon]
MDFKIKLEKLKEFPNTKLLIVITLLGCISYFFMTFVVFAPIELDLKGRTGYGVFEFELAWTSENVNKIFNAWGQDGKNKQLLMTIIDFLYIPAYVAFIAGCLLLVTRNIEGKAQEIGLYMTLTPVFSGIFDVIENVNLILMLIDDMFVWSICPFMASLCATIKFVLLFIAIISFILGLIVLIVQKLK